jgi:putative phosphoribosyl transferase
VVFRDRREAGRLLAERLGSFKDKKGLLVLAIPRGGVVVGYQIAKALGAPLDVYITRKIGAPSNPELAIGAVASDGTLVLDRELAERVGASEEYIEATSKRERLEIERRLSTYREGMPPLSLKDKSVILVDDGIATGATIEATIKALRKAGARQIVLGIPVGPQDTIERLRQQVDEIVYLHAPEIFWAVGSFYLSFEQTSDEEVVTLLSDAARGLLPS